MKVNWKDFLLMYVLGILVFIAAGVVALLYDNNPLVAFPIILLLFFVPGLFYFYRNPSTTKDAAVVSLIFAFTMMPLYLVFIAAISLLLSGLLSQSFPALGEMLKPTNLSSLAITFLAFGFLLSIPTFLSFMVCKHLFKKTLDVEEREGVKETEAERIRNRV